MSEAPYPHPRNIPKGEKRKMRMHEDIVYIPSDVEDVRPTQEFKDAVAFVIRQRNFDETLKVKSLTEHLDLVLANRNLTR